MTGALCLTPTHARPVVQLTPDEIASRAHMATQSSRNRLSIFEKLTRQIHVLFHAPIDGSEPLAFPQHVASLAKAYRSLDLPKVSDVNRKIVRNELSQLYKSAREGLEIPEAMRAIHAELFDAADATFKQPVTAIEDGQLVSRTNVEALFNQIVHPAQQVGAIARARAFLFAACERRAVRGESLDPMSFVRALLLQAQLPRGRTIDSCSHSVPSCSTSCTHRSSRQSGTPGLPSSADSSGAWTA